METSKTGNTSRHRSKSGKTNRTKATVDPDDEEVDVVDGGAAAAAAEPDDDENDQTLTDIAAGKTFLTHYEKDFFGDNENSYYFAFNSMASNASAFGWGYAMGEDEEGIILEPDFNNLPT